MDSIAKLARTTKTLTFDCYGTLIDWYAGLRESLGDIFGDAIGNRWDEVVIEYVRAEAEIESQSFRKYRDVLRSTVEKLARDWGISLPAGRSLVLGDQLPSWSPFPDTADALRRLRSRFRLGILSNIDRDLLAKTVQLIGVEFDFVVTAEDVQSYKPAPGHFERLLGRHADRGSIIHVAQSLFHDGTAAKQHGLPFVWINRYNDPPRPPVPMVRQYADLRTMADELCGEE